MKLLDFYRTLPEGHFYIYSSALEKREAQNYRRNLKKLEDLGMIVFLRKAPGLYTIKKLVNYALN